MVDPVILRHGVLSVRELEDLGLGRSQRESALASGRLERVRTGWFARPDADPDLVAAVRGRACVACASALRLRGAWVPESLGRHHVRAARRNDRWRPDGCRSYGPASPVSSAIDDVATASRCLLRCGSSEDVVVVRLTYRQIVHDWPRVEQDLLAIVRRGGHRRPRRAK